MPRRPRNINQTLARTIIFSGIVLLVVAFLLMRMEIVNSWLSSIINTLRPVIIGAVIALVLYMPTCRFEKMFNRLFKGRKIPSTILSVVCSYLLLAIILVLLCWIIIPQFVTSLTDFSDKFTVYYINFQKFLQGKNGQQIYNIIQDFGINFAQIKTLVSQIADTISGYVPTILEKLGTWTSGIINVVIDIFIGLVFSFYILAGRKKLKSQIKRILKRFLSDRNYKRIDHYGNLTFDVFSNFISGQLSDAVILGLLCFIAMSIFHFHYAVMISTIIGITNIIPIVGPIVGTIPCAFILLLVDPSQVIWFVIMVIVIQQIDSNFIYPRVVGGSIGLPAMWVLFAVTVGGGLFGMTGLVLGVPMMSVIYAVLKEKTAPEGAPQYNPIQQPEKSVIEQKADELFEKMRDSISTAIADAMDGMKQKWKREEGYTQRAKRSGSEHKDNSDKSNNTENKTAENNNTETESNSTTGNNTDSNYDKVADEIIANENDIIESIIESVSDNVDNIK
ncbi:MAG: AI-2E family transporter [Ruminococcus sp.]|nr:AI-2E family transporter [Ruminococcus sp.]